MVNRIFALGCFLSHMSFVCLMTYVGVLMMAMPTSHMLHQGFLRESDWQLLPPIISNGCLALKFAYSHWRTAERALWQRWDGIRTD